MADAVEGPVYRIVTVGQDTLLLLWDFEPPESNSVPEHRRAPSITSLPVPLSPSPTATPGRHLREASRSSDSFSRGRTPSFSGLPAGADSEIDLEGLSFAEQRQRIAASVPREDMLWMDPAAEVQAHQAPICAVNVLQRGVATLCADSRLHLWLRPDKYTASSGGEEAAAMKADRE